MSKYIIEIPDKLYKTLKEYKVSGGSIASWRILEAVANGIPLSNEISQGWIPVTERLPEINVDVIVTDIETTETYSSYYLGDGFWECDNGTHKNRIIAWMPFPKPYKREKTT